MQELKFFSKISKVGNGSFGPSYIVIDKYSGIKYISKFIKVNEDEKKITMEYVI